MGIKKDYRNTDKCPSLSDVETKKNILNQKIREKHPRTKILYNLIKNKQGEYFKEFAEIYNHKCAYCGAVLKFTDIRLFEVDHFICESSFPNDTNGRATAGKVENLVFSCYSCNRGKSRLYVELGYQATINPDDNSIATVFSRDEEYYIKISNDSCKDSFVQLFYEKLRLGSEARRIDFLLLEMDNLVAQLLDSNKELAEKIEQCKSKLLQKKNYALIKYIS